MNGKTFTAVAASLFTLILACSAPWTIQAQDDKDKNNSYPSMARCQRLFDYPPLLRDAEPLSRWCTRGLSVFGNNCDFAGKCPFPLHVDTYLRTRPSSVTV